MSARLFGTDGIRGVAGNPPLDPTTVYRIGFCLTEYLSGIDPQPHILIGRDTRISGPRLESTLMRAIADAGGLVERCGVVSTPAVSLLTRRRGASAGIMISASHNPFQDNGIKIFASTGMKFTDAVEAELERQIAASRVLPPREAPPRLAPDAFSTVVPEYRDLYARELLATVPPDFRLDGVRLVVDCAHGSQSAFAPNFLRRLGAEVEALHCEPDGRNINRDAGALHLDKLRDKVVSRGAQLGIAFDGDADRAMFVDAGGTIRDGDDVLFVFARYLEFLGAPKIVVGTVMANLGLELALAEDGFRLERTAVGDRYVLEEMMRQAAAIGGEQSGHVILSRLARTGDGLLTALQLLAVLRQQKTRGLAELCADLKRYPQVLVNARVREKVPFTKIPGLEEAELRARAELGPGSRMLLRYSGTEKLARVMVEGEDAAKVRAAAEQLAAKFGPVS
jgi:phosphoglucosamine mutase